MILSLLIDGKDLKKLEISTNSSTSEVSSAFWALLDVPEAERASHVLKLYRADGVFIPIGPHIPPSEEPYSLRLKRGILLFLYLVSPLESSQIESLKLGKNVVDEIHEIRKNLLSVKSKIEVFYYIFNYSNWTLSIMLISEKREKFRWNKLK